MTVSPRILSVAVVLAVGLAVVLHGTTDSAVLAEVSYLGVLVAASVVAWVGVARWPRERRLMPSLIAGGLSLNALGDVLWAALERVGADTDVSVADLPWYGSYIFLCLALWTVLSQSREGGRADLDFVVDAVTVVVISLLVFWTFSVEAIVADTSVSPIVRASWSAYPVLDAVLLALVLRLLVSRRARAVVDVWFGLGVCLWLVADVLYIQLPEDPTAVFVMDAAWMVAPVLMARAAWRAHDAEPAGVRREKAMGWIPRMLLAVCPLVVPPGLELIADVRGRDDQPLQLLIGTVVVMALALVRIGRLILSEQRAHRELEVARDAALAASEAKSMFLANMSHEIRTPLTTVLVAAGLLKETPMSEVQQRFVEKVHRSGGQLQTLVEGLLDFSRIEAGRAVLERAEFELRAVVTDVVDAHLPGAQRKGLRLDWEVDPRVPQIVVGDRHRVFQVLNNLVENALKFTEEGCVRLSVCPVEDRGEPAGGVQVTVADTGIGIRDEDQAAIFESFTQVDGSAARTYQGTGLGLAICQQVTELMGGTIAVRSQVGVGTTFTVRFPLTAPESDRGLMTLSP